jgi:hypothetical protein
MRRRLLGLALLASVAGSPLGCDRAAQSTAESTGTTDVCLQDLRAAFELVEKNYSGYADKVSRIGADVIERARQDAVRRAESEGGDRERCRRIVNTWLEVFADRHLGVTDPRGLFEHSEGAEGEKPDMSPAFEILSSEAALIRVRSFDPAEGEALEQLVEQHRAEILARPELIIDLRGNGGGSDSSYRVLAELVYTGPVKRDGLDVLATPANIAGWEAIVPDVGPSDQELIANVLAQMKQNPGEWVEIFPDSTITHEAVLPQPSRVALLTDRGCGSSCEEFVLEARGSSKVRIFGTPTVGNLDYANVRANVLPSGLMLWIGTTRSHRLPDRPLDGVGVLPDIEMDSSEFDGPMRQDALAQVLEDLRNSLNAPMGAPPESSE